MNPLARRLDKFEGALAPPVGRPRIVFGRDSADAEAKVHALRQTGYEGPLMVLRWQDRSERTDDAVNA